MTSKAAADQEGAPLRILLINKANYDLLNAVVMVNVTEKTIVKYQMGWVVTDRNNVGPGAVFLGAPADTYVKAWDVVEAGRQGATFSSVVENLNARGIRRGLVICGVVYVRFADGTEWTYPLQIRGHFTEKHDSELDSRLKPIVKRVLQEKGLWDKLLEQ